MWETDWLPLLWWHETWDLIHGCGFSNLVTAKVIETATQFLQAESNRFSTSISRGGKKTPRYIYPPPSPSKLNCCVLSFASRTSYRSSCLDIIRLPSEKSDTYFDEDLNYFFLATQKVSMERLSHKSVPIFDACHCKYNPVSRHYLLHLSNPSNRPDPHVNIPPTYFTYLRTLHKLIRIFHVSKCLSCSYSRRNSNNTIQLFAFNHVVIREYDWLNNQDCSRSFLLMQRMNGITLHIWLYKCTYDRSCM